MSKNPVTRETNRRNTSSEAQKVSAKSEPDSCRPIRFLNRHVRDLGETASCSSNPVLTEGNRKLDSCLGGMKRFPDRDLLRFSRNHWFDEDQRQFTLFDAIAPPPMDPNTNKIRFRISVGNVSEPTSSKSLIGMFQSYPRPSWRAKGLYLGP